MILMKKKISKKPAASTGNQTTAGRRQQTPSVQNLITKNMSFGEVLQRFPQTMPVFGKYGMHCIGCAMSAFETIEQGALAHRIDVKKFVDDLNTAALGKK
jgi:hybrid cluster-associated redox disulfide protein